MCKFLAERVKHDFKAFPFEHLQIVAISRGGMIPAVLLSHLLGIPIKRTVHISTYDDVKNKNLGAHIINAPGLKEDELGISLFVDDILDTGTTIKAIRNLYGDARFIMPVGKYTGVDNHLDHLIIRPPFMVPDDCWVHFPWELRKDNFNVR